MILHVYKFVAPVSRVCILPSLKVTNAKTACLLPSLNETKEFDRYHCHISPPSDGHILIVDEHCLYKQEQGSVYKWPSRKSWHAGANCGLVSKYIFNVWG